MTGRLSHKQRRGMGMSASKDYTVHLELPLCTCGRRRILLFRTDMAPSGVCLCGARLGRGLDHFRFNFLLHKGFPESGVHLERFLN